MVKKVIFFGLCWMMFFGGPVSSWGGQPEQEVAKYIDMILDTFQNYDENCTCEQFPQGNATVAREFLRQRLRSLAQEVFSFRIMSMMALGRSWKQLTARQQQEFTDVFELLLERSYFDKVMKYVKEVKEYSRKNITIVGEKIFSRRKAEVRTKIKYKDKFIPVNYRLVKLGSVWRVYDINVEGVSLIGNYRSQFREMLLHHSPAQLLEKLKHKVHKDEAAFRKFREQDMKQVILYGLCCQGKKMKK